MSCCATEPHTVVPWKRGVVFTQHPHSISPIMLLFFCNTLRLDVAFLQHLEFCCIFATPPGPQDLSTWSGLSRPADLWRSLNPLTPLSLFDAVEPHWSSLKPLSPLNRSYSRQSNARLSGLCDGVFPNMPTDRSTIFCELGCLGAVIEAHPRGHPSCVYLLIYYGLATLSTENEAI